MPTLEYLASDEEDALRVASNLVVDAGFDPVVVGALDRAREFDIGTATSRGYC